VANETARNLQSEKGFAMTVSMYAVSIFNLARQVRAATDHAANAAGRLSGKEETKDISIIFPSGQTRQFTGNIKQSEIDGSGNTLPNFFFHTTTAYDILRQYGVEIGKRDFMGTPPSS
jgi:uncharacterized protein